MKKVIKRIATIAMALALMGGTIGFANSNIHVSANSGYTSGTARINGHIKNVLYYQGRVVKTYNCSSRCPHPSHECTLFPLT